LKFLNLNIFENDLSESCEAQNGIAKDSLIGLGTLRSGGGSCEAANWQSDIKQICGKTPDFIKVIPATPEPKFTESGPEPEFRRNFEPRGRRKEEERMMIPVLIW
jgi:hypothetical protein